VHLRALLPEIDPTIDIRRVDDAERRDLCLREEIGHATVG